MTTQPVADDAYAAVEADIEQQIAELQTALRAIRAIRVARIGVVTMPPKAEAAPDSPGAFLGMSIPEAAKKLLMARRQKLTSSEIAAALKLGGLAMTSADPANMIGSILGRRFDQVGDVVRVERGVWGLQEWYPHTSFRKKVSFTNSGQASASPGVEGEHGDGRAWEDLPPDDLQS